MRSYGRFTTSLYRDEDFRSLTLAEQGVYLMLGLQPEMSAAGKLDLTVRRWSDMSAGTTRDEFAEHLGVLAEHGHIVIDWDTEELLLTKFVKWDGGLENSKRQPVIREAALMIASTRIRDSLAQELVGIGHTDLARELSDGPSGSDRVVVTEGGNGLTPQSSIPEGEPLPLDDVEPAQGCPKHPNGTDKPCGPCGSARQRLAAWTKRQERAASDLLNALTAARRECPLCDDLGMRLDPETHMPAGRCDHRRSA